MNLTPDMSLTEVLSAVATGAVVGEHLERGGDWVNVWAGTDGDRVTPWDTTGRRLDFLERRGIVRVRDSRWAELTALGWRRFEQLARQRLAEQERDHAAEAVAASAYLGKGMPPGRWSE